MQVPRTFKTATFRLTAVYAGVFAVSLAVILAIVILLVGRSMHKQIASAARDDALVLARAYAGQDAKLDVSARSASNRQTSYFVRNGRGDIVIDEFDPGTSPTGEFVLGDTRKTRDSGEEPGNGLIAYGITTNGAGYIAAARTDEAIVETREAVIEAALIAGMIALSLAVIGGFIMSALALRRVNQLDQTATAIFDGDLDRRMPINGTGDEYDRLAASLNRMLDRISELLDRLKQVSNDIAHDLRTPLTRLRQQLEALGKDVPQDQHEIFDAVVREADSILTLFGSLLQIAQVEGGNIKQRFSNVSLSDLLIELGQIYQPVAEGAGQTLKVIAQPDIFVTGNRELLTQMAVNLLENAIRHTAAGTVVHVDLRLVAAGAVLTVSDDGPGIPASEQEKIFRRFYRGDASRTTPGTGLGLALVTAIADAHGMTMIVEDNEPGARFVLMIPRSCIRTPDGQVPNSA